jgi:repressor LexA
LLEISITERSDFMNVGQRIQQKMKEQRLSQNKLAKAAQLSQAGISAIISGQVSPKEVTLSAIANALNCSVSELMGEIAPGIIPIVRKSVPIIGSIACGERVSPDTEAEGYADLPDGVKADFALRCKGDSMIPTFINGDLVLIRQQPEVNNGQIAAVNIEGETTLKHLYHQDSGVLLVADNPSFSPVFVPAEKEIIVHGLAVGYVRMF